MRRPGPEPRKGRTRAATQSAATSCSVRHPALGDRTKAPAAARLQHGGKRPQFETRRPISAAGRPPPQTRRARRERGGEGEAAAPGPAPEDPGPRLARPYVPLSLSLPLTPTLPPRRPRRARGSGERGGGAEQGGSPAPGSGENSHRGGSVAQQHLRGRSARTSLSATLARRPRSRGPGARTPGPGTAPSGRPDAPIGSLGVLNRPRSWRLVTRRGASAAPAPPLPAPRRGQGVPGRLPGRRGRERSGPVGA